MKTRFVSKTGRAWLAAALPLCATLMSSPALADDAVGGNANNGLTVVNTAACQWTVLETVTFQNPTTRYCIATGSADAIRPTTFAGPEHTYYFTVSNATNPICNQGQERTLTFWNQGGILDNSKKEITTTGGWMAPANADPGYFTVPAAGIFGNRTLYFLARKAAAATPPLTVDDASLTVTCTDKRLASSIIVNPVLTQ
ncbi:MAG: hypothetical protein ACREXS_12130 [Gammaproteobacteria bacterium]